MSLGQFEVSLRNDATEPEITGVRARIVHLCARIIGDPDAAEDLAQQALILGLRRAEDADPTVHERWLLGVARNLCLHWLRDRGRENSRMARTHLTSDEIDPGRRDLRLSPDDL